jgi:hypothetical protein
VLAFYKLIRRRYPEHLRIYLINDNLSLHWTPPIRARAARRQVELVATPTSASHLNRIEYHFQPLPEFVLKASDYVSHGDVALAFRRYLHRRNTDHQQRRIRQVKSCPIVRDTIAPPAGAFGPRRANGRRATQARGPLIPPQTSETLFR